MNTKSNATYSLSPCPKSSTPTVNGPKHNFFGKVCIKYVGVIGLVLVIVHLLLIIFTSLILLWYIYDINRI